MRITEAEKNAKIRQAYENAVPDIRGVILADCKQGKGQVVLMEDTGKKKGVAKYIMAAAACLLLVFGGGLGLNVYHANYTVASTVSLEVNPSIQIMVNEKERVLDVKALNRDGEIVIGDMDFSGSDIDVVVNALIGSMLRNGYLNEIANSILISVDNADPAKGALLQEKLTKEVNEILASDGFLGAVLSQTLTESENLQKQADLYGITLGKAQLIEQVLNSTTGHTFDELAPLSINELNLLLTTTEAESEKVFASGSASDKAYIGGERALEIALAHGGIPKEEITTYKMDMDLEKGVMVYELEFQYGGYEYEYDVDAQTGEIIKNRKEIDDDVTKTPDENFVLQQNDAVTSTTDHNYYAPQHHEERYYGDYHHSDSDYGGEYYSGEYYGADSQNPSAAVTVEQAKEIALNHAGQTAKDAYFEKAELDYDDGRAIYELEFRVGTAEYEYEIDAATGDILEYDWDHH